MKTVSKPTEWRNVKTILLNKGISVQQIGPKTHMLYECNTCGFIIDHATHDKLPACYNCNNNTDLLGSSDKEVDAWYVLNDFNGSMHTENDFAEEVDIFHIVCDCINPINIDLIDPNNLETLFASFTTCEFVNTVFDPHLLVPLCNICNGCIFCRYYDEHYNDDNEEDIITNYSN